MSRFNFPPPGKQVYLAAFLSRIRENGGLRQCVRDAARDIDATELRRQLENFVPADGLQALQGSGIRDEEVFVVPAVLNHSPGTLIYYRLLLGVSQKQFYSPKSGLKIFRPLEDRQEITQAAKNLLDEFCCDMNSALRDLIHALPAASLHDDIDHLPLLTLGAQADGSWRGQIGAKATKGVFEAMKAIVRGQGKPFSETDISITVTNNSQREVTLALAPDPDVVIREDVRGSVVYKVAIEIKGGTDYANLHNRAGEAEKSHQKARNSGAQDCWTVITLERANLDLLKKESPTTREWIDIQQVLDRSGSGWSRLETLTLSAMGI